MKFHVFFAPNVHAVILHAVSENLYIITMVPHTYIKSLKEDDFSVGCCTDGKKTSL